MLSLQTLRYFNRASKFNSLAGLFDNQARAYFSVSFDANKDYYKVLGVSQSSTDKQIKAAYFSLAKKYHPDVNKGNAERFKEISDAYSVIGEDKKRKDYDAARKFSSGASGFGASRTSQGQQPYGGYGNSGYGQSHQGSYTNQKGEQKSYYYNNSNSSKRSKSRARGRNAKIIF